MKLVCAAMVIAIVAGSAPPAASAHPEIYIPPPPKDTLGRIVRLPEIVVSTARSGDRAPLTRTVLRRDDILERNWGQDTPMALAELPGAYAYSDAGNGIGYSYLSIRGFPQRRISVLVNGVPLNDPESHEVYWIDHPDLLSSAAEVEMQRGVGSALYGAASLGGSVNVETAPFSDAPRASVALAYGSYETKRLMAEMNSGPLAGGWSFYGRYSRIESFGYREQSGSRLWSYALSARRLMGDHSLHANIYGGPEETHLAYLGVPREYLDGAITGDPERDRRFNPITYKNERDHFFEPHYELIHSWSPGGRFTLSQTAFFFDGRGYYDERRLGANLADYRLAPWTTSDSTLFDPTYYDTLRTSDSTFVLRRDAQGNVRVTRFDVERRRTVVNRHYGWVPRVRIEHPGGALTFGGEVRWHDGRHWGEVLSGNVLPPGTESEHTYYDYHPRTRASGLFLREEWQARSALLVTADLAWRHQSYFMRGDRFDRVRFDQPYDFALPRLGFTWTPRTSLSAFASWANSSREPAFRDLYDAEGVGSVPLYRTVDVARGIYQDPLIRPEKVNDYEAGGSWRGDGLTASLNLFRMDFRDELVFFGQYDTDLGYPILGNAAKSVHQGVEAALRTSRRVGSDLDVTLEANGTLSDNHFVRYREVYGPTPADVVSYDGKAISLFPAVLGNLSARVEWRPLLLGAEVRRVGRIYLDNNESTSASTDPHTVLNLIGGLRLVRTDGARVQVSLRVNNATGLEYETSGYMDFDDVGNLTPRFVPAATRNLLGEVRVEW